MKLNLKEKRAFSKYLGMLLKMIKPELGVSVHWLPDDSTDLGYTYRKKGYANVYLNSGTLPEIFDDMSKEESILFITGVAVHEFMHQILTNFVLTEKTLNKVDSPSKRKLLQFVMNLFEDSRIESFAPSYFAGQSIAALNYTIQAIWDKSPEINPESDTLSQVLNALIQYGDIGLTKPEMSEEARELFERVIPLFNEAIEAKSCSVCIYKAQAATEILLPYFKEESEMPSAGTSSSGDSKGEDAEDSDAASAARTKKIKRRPAESKDSKSGDKKSKDSADDKADKADSGDDTDDKSDDSGSGKTSDDSKTESDDSTGISGTDKELEDDSSEEDETGGESSASGLGSDGLFGDDASEEFSDSEDADVEDYGEIEDKTEMEEADPEAFEKAAKSLLETLEYLEGEDDAAEERERSDFELTDIEKPKGDVFVRTISHHKAESAPEMYESYLSIVSSDAHEIAKTIDRAFRVKSGGKKRSDHGDLNIMRYKDPTFKSPYIFDKKNPKVKHSVAVMLLVDESGSMSYGARITQARLAAIMLAEAMAEANIPCCIVGHSGDDKYDCSVEFEHYTTFKNAKVDRQSLPMIDARLQNRDGPAIRWCSSILKKRPERKKLLVVISDGAPCADDYGGNEAIFDTKAAIREAKRLFDVVGVVLEAGYSTDILRTMYGEDFVECEKASDLSNCIKKVIERKCKTW